MNAVERLGSYIFRGVYTVSGPFHPFGGAVDIIVVEQPDGSFKSSPWYVRFGKFQGVLKTREKIVNISVNGTDAGFHMYLDHKGQAYFLREVDGEEDGNVSSAVTSGDEMDEQSLNDRLADSQSANFDGKQLDMISQIDASNGKIVSRTNSRRSRIFGLMFGRKSMKDDSRLRKGEIDMQRINSLERAEIAADLLEVRWSTSLSTRNGKTNVAAGLSVPEAPSEEAPKDTEVSGKQQISSPSGHDSMNSCVLDVKNSCLQNYQQNVQAAHDAENVHANELPASEPSVIDLRGPSFESEASMVSDSSDFRCSSTGKKSNKEDSLLTRDIPDEESQQHGVSTYTYRETSVSIGSGINGSGGGGSPDNLNFGHISEEVEAYTEVLYDANELISNMKSGMESDVYMVKESLVEFDDSNLGLARMENLESCKVEDRGTTASEKSIERSISLESSSVDSEQMQPLNHYSIDTQLLGLDSVESKTQEVIHQNAAIKKFPPVKTSATELTESSEEQSQLTGTLSSMQLSNGEGNERATSTHGCHVGSSKVDDTPGSINNEESEGICISSSIGNLRNQEQETEILGDGIDVHEPLPLSGTFVGTRDNFLPQEVINTNILDEDQFLFSDNDDFAESAIRLGDFTSADVMQTDGQETECSAEEHEPDNISHLSPLPSGQSLESCSGSYSGDLTQTLLPNIAEDLPMESQTQASPLSIPKSHRSEKEGPCSVRSLPNIRNHIHDLESSNVCKHLSRSLDSRTESLDWSMLRKDLPCSLKSKLVAESDVAEDHPTANSGPAEMVDACKMIEHEETSSNPAVEISLCGHLLFEGMGADAASRAFDSEKLDFKKFGDLGPSIVKNDKLVVRIGGRYFPWDAAAPIIVGMVSFGREPNFELEGMIAVDQVEKTLQGKLSRTTAPSGGSWRIWPFSLRKSKNELSVLQDPDDMKGNVPGANDDASDSGREVTEDYKMNKSRTPKKKAVSSLFPTSEQLMSLNLKEGQNVITFTFSTAMLGRQQVHARIYVWKWSTRIVISDVDGTITKSDVLGQFMPWVGRDWSQYGVAHLFSAIKENGYQFLFLSARSISQADLTRQFLFNLKQDGKALPDGPVLISPDGLFPSLYREVIRRAPHEFKIACLEDIRSLFPPDCNPFYAGYGNRDTDEFSYLKVGIPKGKIFIINPKGEVAVNHWVNTKSYTSLHALVNGMFPAMSSSEQEEYNSWNYWRPPLPQIDV